ncbi:MAG: B12-binding domain-containing protein [Vicinamibacterales bacterium]
MLSWCSYCQEFQGERPPFDLLALTHGICDSCAENVFTITDREMQHARVLQRIQTSLSEAGHQNDVEAAARALDDATTAQIRAVDVLLGIIAPLLYEIGEDWRRAVISVAEEHRFSMFCEEVVKLVEARLHADPDAARVASGPVDALLMNAPGNRHTLGIHVLRLWLLSKGVHGRVLDPAPRPDEFAAVIQTLQPRMLLISIAMAEQSRGAQAIVERVRALPGPGGRIRIIAGGNAVKLGHVTSIPGLELTTDIHAVPEMLTRWEQEPSETVG